MDVILGRFPLYATDKPTHQAVYDALRDAVVVGYIPIGKRLIEKEYAEMFNVSRTPIRKALKKLVQDSLVVHDENGHLIAKGLCSDDINNIFNLQRALEHITFPHTMLKMTKKVSSDLLKELDSIEKLMDVDILEASLKNDNLHRKLFELSELSGIVDIVNMAFGFTQAFSLISSQDKVRQHAITAEHRTIVESMMMNDSNLLCSAGDFHIEACKMYCIKKYIENVNRKSDNL